MGKLIDIKPTAGLADIRPSSASLLNVKPRNLELGKEITRSYQVVLGANMYVGLPFIPFYRDAGTVTQWSEVG